MIIDYKRRKFTVIALSDKKEIRNIPRYNCRQIRDTAHRLALHKFDQEFVLLIDEEHYVTIHPLTPVLKKRVTTPTDSNRGKRLSDNIFTYQMLMNAFANKYVEFDSPTVLRIGGTVSVNDDVLNMRIPTVDTVEQFNHFVRYRSPRADFLSYLSRSDIKYLLTTNVPEKREDEIAWLLSKQGVELLIPEYAEHSPGNYSYLKARQVFSSK